MDRHEKQLEVCVSYFRERPVYQKLFEKFYEKYKSLGRLGGKVVLTGLREQDRQHLGGFLQKNFSGQKSVTVSFESMEKALKKSRFSELSWEEILEDYLGEALISRKEREKLEETKRRQFFQDVLDRVEASPGKRWLEQTLQERGEGFVFLMQQYGEQPGKLRELLLTFIKSIDALPESPELLAVFSARTTGNPHFFDEGMPGERLLIAFLNSRSCGKEMVFSGMSAAERKNRILYEAGILKDNLSNDTLVYGIHARKKDGTLHRGIEGFFEEKEPVKLTLLTLGNLSKIWGQDGASVYVVENPAVFSELMQKYPDRTLVCGNGQPRLATFVLLDRLAENRILYYAGDFDPEGLLIAQRLKERYKDRLVLWNYETDFYEKYISSVRLEEARLKKLEKVVIPELLDIKRSMLIKKCAAYQETMIEQYLNR
ncbi:MAG: TIGR02679 family protein [Blautia sp.]